MPNARWMGSRNRLARRSGRSSTRTASDATRGLDCRSRGSLLYNWLRSYVANIEDKAWKHKYIIYTLAIRFRGNHMSFYCFPESSLILEYEIIHNMLTYDQEKMCAIHNWYTYRDMTQYNILEDLITKCEEFFKAKYMSEYIGSIEQKRLDSMRKLLADYKVYRRVTDGRLFWKRMELIDKKIKKEEIKN